jgi:hypothetical protein
LPLATTRNPIEPERVKQRKAERQPDVGCPAEVLRRFAYATEKTQRLRIDELECVHDGTLNPHVDRRGLTPSASSPLEKDRALSDASGFRSFRHGP